MNLRRLEAFELHEAYDKHEPQPCPQYGVPGFGDIFKCSCGAFFMHKGTHMRGWDVPLVEAKYWPKYWYALDRRDVLKHLRMIRWRRRQEKERTRYEEKH